MLFMLGMACGWYIGSYAERLETEESKGYQIRLGGYRLINPLLDCEIAGDKLRERELQPSKSKVTDLIAGAKQDGRASSVLGYFRENYLHLVCTRLH